MHDRLPLIATLALAGCSLVYNPSNLPDKTTQPPDAAIADANPALLHLDEVMSPPLLEGAGQGGSTPQILVVYGRHITKAAQVAVAPAVPNADVALELSDLSIADDGNSFATLVRAGYMDAIDEAAGPIELTVTVTQDGATPQTIVWPLRPLDQLGPGAQPAPAPGKLFSHADVTADVTFLPGPDRAIVVAVGGIKLQRVTANAADRSGGAGGCDGGAASADAMGCFGGGKAAGGGGGFGTAGTNGAANTAGPASGDPLVKSYDGAGAALNKAGGGGGGAAAGGGGGGTIELTAGGDLEVAMLSATGANGGAPGVNVGRGAGGGAGGLIVLRAGGTLTHPTSLTIGGGGGGAGTLGAGGDGGLGRWRFDAAAVVGTPPPVNTTTTPSGRRGPMIVRPANPIFEQPRATLMISGESGDEVTLITLYPDGTSETKITTLTGTVSTVTPPELAIGLNTVCVIVPGGNFANDEAKNCVDLAFVP